ncbi:MAG TPA: hypothetical protein VHN98_11045 [Acidimicrobiales bacterium]|nr:hypothetical protein [Acidimicrobiales bacterium]
MTTTTGEVLELALHPVWDSITAAIRLEMAMAMFDDARVDWEAALAPAPEPTALDPISAFLTAFWMSVRV